jgi:hypothetical protein
MKEQEELHWFKAPLIDVANEVQRGISLNFAEISNIIAYHKIIFNLNYDSFD